MGKFATALLLAGVAFVQPVFADESVNVAMHTGGNAARHQIVVVARVAHSASKHQPRLEAFGDWLAKHLKGEGIVAGAGVVARSPKEMISFLREGQVDVVSESVLTAIRYEQAAGAEILRHEWRDGRPYYQTVFITLRGAPLFTLQDLVGKRIAFEDRGSSTGFLLPLAVMLRAGLKPVVIPDPEAPVPEGTVGYVFAGSETNISAWTAAGLVDAGAYSNRNWDSKKSNPRRYRNKMRVFHVTMPLLHSVILVRRGLRPELRRAIGAALDAFAAAPDAIPIREEYYDVARYDPITGEAARDLAEARMLYRSVRDLFD